MKKMKVPSLIIGILLLSFLYISCATKVSAMSYDDAFVVIENADLSAGHLWESAVDYNSEDLVKLVGVKYEELGDALNPNGVYRFYFMPLKVGVAKIIFKLKNIVNGDVLREKKVSYEIYNDGKRLKLRNL